MTCRHVAQLRDTYLDGELSPGLTAELHAHLLQCPACQEHFEMFRACAELITKDRPEVKLDSGFASRVVAALPRPSVSLPDLGLRTRRDRRRRFWWRVAGAGLPAAAAVLFFTVLIWPTGAPNGSGRFVLGEAREATGLAGVKDVAAPALDAGAKLQDAAGSLSLLQQILVDEARRDVDAGERAVRPSRETTLLDAFLQPFRDVLQPIEEEEAAASEPDDLVRF